MTQVLIVSAGARRFGIDLDAVAEIVDNVVVTTLPRLPRAITGVVEVRGSVVPLIDVGALDGNAAAYCGGRRAAVLASDGVRPLALAIDEVEGIVDVSETGGAEVLDLPHLFEVIA